jgi:hypothetical protein
MTRVAMANIIRICSSADPVFARVVLAEDLAGLPGKPAGASEELEL